MQETGCSKKEPVREWSNPERVLASGEQDRAIGVKLDSPDGSGLGATLRQSLQSLQVPDYGCPVPTPRHQKELPRMELDRHHSRRVVLELLHQPSCTQVPQLQQTDTEKEQTKNKKSFQRWKMLSWVYVYKMFFHG